MTVLPSHALRLVKKLMPLSRPIRNLTKLTQIPHLAPGMLPQALPSLVPSSSNCRNRLQSCSLRGRYRFFFLGGRGGGGRGEQKEKYRGRARVSGEARKECPNEPPNREKNKKRFLVAPATISWRLHRSRTSPGTKLACAPKPN